MSQRMWRCDDVTMRTNNHIDSIIFMDAVFINDLAIDRKTISNPWIDETFNYTRVGSASVHSSIAEFLKM